MTDILARNFEESMSCEDKPCVKGGMPWKHSHMRDADIYQQHTTLHILVTRCIQRHVCLCLSQEMCFVRERDRLTVKHAPFNYAILI